MTADGDIWHSVGVVDAVNVVGAPLDGATVIHNHPEEAEAGSFGSDDFKFLKDYPEIAELWAVTRDYDHRVRVLKPLDISYNYAYVRSRFDDAEDPKHLVMEWLHEHGYIEYRRTHV